MGLEGNFTEAIVQCFNAPRASAFDYNLLEPLQKLLRLSSPVAASLARTDMFSGILQKLNHKKAVVRLNLLRIVRSICDPNDEQAENVQSHGLFEAIQRLAESDNAVLVRNMASELVKANLDKDPESGSGGRPRPGQMNRASQSSFVEGNVTPRRMVAPSGSNDSILYRPASRDGPKMTRRTSAEIASSSSMIKSRLPRTSMLRGSRSSLATVSVGEDSGSAPTSSRRENGVRLTRDQSRSGASPAPGGTAPQLQSKRRTRQPSGDIKWS